MKLMKLMSEITETRIKKSVCEINLQEVERKEQEVVNFDEFPPEVLIKHPLQHTWTLWYYEPDRNKTWEESQRKITSFDTAEDFWR